MIGRLALVPGILGALLAGCGAADQRPDVLLVTIDTLRRDHVSAYGHPYAETPVIDRLASEGVLFERHHAVTGLTAPAHTTLFTGLHPREHGLRRNGQHVPSDLPLLAEVYARAGYRTGASIGAAVIGSEFGLDRGFSFFDEEFDVGDIDRASREQKGAYERLAEDVVAPAIEWLAASDGEAPLFLWVHLFDPHLPHLRPRDEWPFVAELVEAGCVLAEPNDFQDEARIARLRRGYTAEVRYTDEQLGRLVDAFDARAGERDDVVLVTADHGEGLGEHSYIGHSFYLYQEQLAIPLVVRTPSRLPAGGRVGVATTSIDVAATLLDLSGLAVPRELGGASLVPLALGGTSETPVFAERPPLADATRRLRRGKERPDDPRNLQGRLIQARAGEAGGGELGLVAVIHDDLKLIWAEDVPDELYDLASDPRELHDLGQDDARAELLRKLVASWRRERAQRYTLDGKTTAATREMLDALGY